MKLFCLIFSFYLLLLSVQSCQDLAAGKPFFSRAESNQAQFVAAGERKDAQTETHECSPFCICSCRQTPLTDKTLAFSSREKITVSVKSAAQIARQNVYSHQHFQFIWQPPKSNFTV